jgi:hypothetical protein
LVFLRFFDGTELVTGNKTGYVFNLNHTEECCNINSHNILGFKLETINKFLHQTSANIEDLSSLGLSVVSFGE